MDKLTTLGKFIVVVVFVGLLGTALGLQVKVQTDLNNRVTNLEIREASKSAVIVPTVAPTATPSAVPTVFLRKVVKPTVSVVK